MTTLDGDLTSLSPAELGSLLQGLEQERRSIAARETAVLAEVTARGSHAEFGCRDAKTYVANLLNIPPAEAQSRLKLAGAVGPRRNPFTGEDLGVRFPVAAAALAEGGVDRRVDDRQAARRGR